jgi:ribosomal protein S27AE
MDDMKTRPGAGSTAVADVPERRSCTRCDGEQRLVSGHEGFGKYHCDRCGLTVGFDLEADPAEFLIDRGQPGRYSKDLYSSRLVRSERRLP